MEGCGIEITVTTPSRLHFSMIDLRGDLGRIHGSVGVAIDRPRIVLNAKKAPEITTSGPRAERVKEFARLILKETGVSGGVEFELVSDIPEHSGFGSGTQLGLAVGTAISELYGLELMTEEIAITLDRSRRSGIGTYAFKYGGFIVDGGHRTDSRRGIPPLIFRSDIPEDWLFVIGVPEIDGRHSGSVETNAFKRLEPPPAELTSEISRIVLLQMIPAIIERDITTFGKAMTSIDFRFGDFFKDIQGGRFTHPIIEAGVHHLLETGALGVGQSSWGPAFYGLVDGEVQARTIMESLERFLKEVGKRGEVFVAKPHNHGAVVVRSDN
ncbi:MAG: kinase [Candidatus Bathyarchaeota archaeon]